MLNETVKQVGQQTANTTAGSIMILGYVHSGTSLLKLVLSKEPTLYAAAGESHFFRERPRIRQRYPDLADAQMLRDYIDFLIKLCNFGYRRATWHGDSVTLNDMGVSEDLFEAMVTDALGMTDHTAVYRLVLDHLTAAEDKTRWLMKSPDHVFVIQDILKAWPDVKIIEMVRDPRAAIASRKIRQDDEWQDRKAKKSGMAVDKGTNYDPVLDTLLWREALDTARQAKKAYPNSILTVRYEDLVTEPEATVRRVCDFAGLAFMPEMLEVGWVNSATQNELGVAREPGISTAAIDQWKERLSAEDVAVCQWIVRDEMRRLDYKPMPVSATTRLRTPLVAGRAVGNLWARYTSERPPGVEGRSRDATRRIYRRFTRKLGIGK